MLTDLPVSNIVDHAYRYFARYLALSIGHYPILPGVAEVPFYAIFGISVFSARLSSLFFMLLTAVVFYLFCEAVYDRRVAFLTTLLLVTTPFVVGLSQVVMSEMPALFFVILTLYLFYQYCASDQKKYMFETAFSLSFSLYAKHHTIFMVPALLVYFLINKGPRALLRKELLISYAIATVLVLPLIFITLKFSQTNISWVTSTPMSARLSSSNFVSYPLMLWTHQLTAPVFILSVLSLLVSIYKRDKRPLLFVVWVLALYALLALLGVKQHPRYAVYWIPPFCLFAAMGIGSFKSRRFQALISTVVLIVGGYQFVMASQTMPSKVAGYEDAAKYVVLNRKGSSVLYSGIKDTGYFTFFVRKHDPARDLIVLRADKVLATSRMDQIVENKITDSEGLYKTFSDFGIGYVVIEYSETTSQALNLLRMEVKSEKFVLRKEIIIQSNRERMDGKILRLYEYKDHGPAKAGVMLQMGVPLMGDSIEIPFDDLLQSSNRIGD